MQIRIEPLKIFCRFPHLGNRFFISKLKLKYMLRIAVQSKGRLYDETMELLSEAGIKLTAMKRTLLVSSRNFPVELLFLRDDDIPESVASGTSDIGIVGLNEVMEKNKNVKIIRNLGFSKCHLALAIPQKHQYNFHSHPANVPYQYM